MGLDLTWRLKLGQFSLLRPRRGMEHVPALFPPQVPREGHLVVGEMNRQKYLWEKNTEYPSFRNRFSLRLSSVLVPQVLKAENFAAFKGSDFVSEAQDGTAPQSFPFCTQTRPPEARFGITPEGWNF